MALSSRVEETNKIFFLFCFIESMDMIGILDTNEKGGTLMKRRVTL